MKRKIEELVERRTNEKCYLIEDREGDFFAIHGSYFGRISFGVLYDSILAFKRNDVAWEFIEKRIVWDRDEDDFKRENRNWVYIKDVESEIINIQELIIDGEVQEVK